jgi:two-component system OmpR family response regulator
MLMNAQTHGSDTAHHRPSRKVRATTATRVSQQHILLVDDDCGVRESLAGVLAEEGFLVLSAANGVEALDVASASPVDLVILDLNMPVKNGWDTFERLSAEHPLVPVIIATARPNQLFTALGAGVGALLEKPLDIPQLLTTIRRLLMESSETRLRRLIGQESSFDYKPSHGGPKNSLVKSVDTKP